MSNLINKVADHIMDNIPEEVQEKVKYDLVKYALRNITVGELNELLYRYRCPGNCTNGYLYDTYGIRAAGDNYQEEDYRIPCDCNNGWVKKEPWQS